jgi:hypothetical protein
VPSTTSPPGARDAGRRLLVVLAEHVERPDDDRLQAGQLEAAEPEVHPRRIAQVGHRGHPLGVDLQADHLQAGDLGAQPLGQLEGGHRRRAVAEVDHERPGGVAQPGHLGGDQPPVHPPEPVGVGRAPRRQPECPGAAGGQPRRPRAGEGGPALVVAAGVAHLSGA